MKPLDKKDMPKLYALGGLAVCLFGYAVYSFTSGSAPTPAGAASPPKSDPNAPPVPNAPGAPSAADAANGKYSNNTPAPGPGNTIAVVNPAGNPGAANPMDALMFGPPTGGKDPFMPVGSAAPKTAPIAAPAPAPSNFRPMPAPRPQNMGGMNRFLDGAAKIMGVNPNPTTAAGVTQGSPNGGPIVLPPPEPPEMVVTGVVLGDLSSGAARNVAIMRGKSAKGEEERRFVSVGDPLGNGFTVTAVHADGVDIKDKTRRITLKLGSAGDNARAK